ncbi:hypothetical protein C0Q70_14238 [Pomacea canaliculata]|uniref:Uncharacterized protein n=1 Tax=Pomacea canaliculata TaxID=400727 RepID=A0A2T7NZG3_POMCA|nr:hypothetical protein C0Q70_14238 [Pomacea canaliculata]
MELLGTQTKQSDRNADNSVSSGSDLILLRSVMEESGGILETCVNRKSRRGTYQAPNATGTKWTLVPGHLKQLDVGRDIVVGVNSKNEILYRKDISDENPTGSDWVQLDGCLKHVTVSPYGAIWGIYFRDGISPQNPAGTSWQMVDGKLTQISAGPSGVWGVNANDDIFYREGTYGGHVTMGSGWTNVPGTLAYITSGSEVVVGVNREKRILRRTEISEGSPTVYNLMFRLDLTNQSDRNADNSVSSGPDLILLRPGTYQAPLETGTEWTLVLGRLRQLDVGTDIVVGVSSIDEIFYRKNITGEHPTGSGWVTLDGRLKQVTVSPNGTIWGVSHDNLIFFRKGISLHRPGGTSWQKVDGSLTQISAGPSGVWGVDANEDIFYREGTYGGHITVGSGWTPVSGKLTYITSGSGMVLGVSSKTEMFRRTGISETNPTGYKWDKFGEGQIMIEEYGGTMWMVSRLHEILIFNGY